MGTDTCYLVSFQLTNTIACSWAEKSDLLPPIRSPTYRFGHRRRAVSDSAENEYAENVDYAK